MRLCLTLGTSDKHSGDKLADRWIGPFQVIRRIGLASAYELELPKTMPNIHDVFHVSLLKRYVADPLRPPPPVPNLTGSELEWEEERVLDHRDVKISAKSRRTKHEVLAKWKWS